jgi:hypothetical protein
MITLTKAILATGEADSRDSVRVNESYAYLSERPCSAMVRAFIVYLCVIAGLHRDG